MPQMTSSVITLCLFVGHATQPPHCTGQGISLLENLESYASKLVEPITYVYSVEPLNNAD